jgi:hypothetical protein
MEHDSIKDLVKILVKHRPIDHNTPKSLFLRPMKNPNGTVWFIKQPIGSNTLGDWLPEICKKLSIPGKCTHHSF